MKKAKRCGKILGCLFCKFGETFVVLLHRKKGEREVEAIEKREENVIDTVEAESRKNKV